MPWPAARAFSATDGGAAFAGDRRLLTTITPDGDGLRDRAAIHFILNEPVTATLEVWRARRPPQLVFRLTRRLGGGPHTLIWAPAAMAPGSYDVRLVLLDRDGERRSYGDARLRADSGARTPVVRVLGIAASFARQSAAPKSTAILRVATDGPVLAVQMFRAGTEHIATYRDGVMHGREVTSGVHLDWRQHRDRAGRIAIRIGDWPSGVYYARIYGGRGRVGYAPLIVHPRRLGDHRVAVVLPTNTWQAYNFSDGNGDGVGDTWYAGGSRRTVALDRPYLDRGEPPYFRRYDLPFLHWLAWGHHAVDYLADSDLELVRSGERLARAYDLIVFPGHHEYVTAHEYNVIRRYRDLGGNLAFLSANNFFWRVDRRRETITRIARWRRLGRPEAALIGVQYCASDNGQRKGGFVVRDTAAAPWLFAGTGLISGSLFTGFGYAAGPFGIEIDARAPSSPPNTTVLAEIPDLFGSGVSAEMTYYETPASAKVFAAGAFTLAGAATSQPVDQLLKNLWSHLAVP